MKITVLGGSGFLGSHVADKLSQKGHKVTIFDKKKSKWLKKTQKMIVGDIQNFNTLKNAIKGSDVVYNFAAIADIGEALKNPTQSVKTNILGNVNVLELCKRYKVKRVVFASTIYVHSNQGSFYRVSKQASELYIEEFSRTFNLNYTILRFGSIYGPRADKRNGLSRIISTALKTGSVKYTGTAKAIRQFVYVQDAAKASVDILKKQFINKNILITGKKTSKIKDLLHKISKLLDISKRPKFNNETQRGHYDISPYSYKPKSDKKYSIKPSITLNEGLLELIHILKNKK